MNCKVCGSKNMRVRGKGLTEYHDASVEFHGLILANEKFSVTGSECKGSFYLFDVWVICNDCGETRQVMREGEYIDGEDDQLYIDMERLFTCGP